VAALTIAATITGKKKNSPSVASISAWLMGRPPTSAKGSALTTGAEAAAGRTTGPCAKTPAQKLTSTRSDTMTRFTTFSLSKIRFWLANRILTPPRIVKKNAGQISMKCYFRHSLYWRKRAYWRFHRNHTHYGAPKAPFPASPRTRIDDSTSCRIVNLDERGPPCCLFCVRRLYRGGLESRAHRGIPWQLSDKHGFVGRPAESLKCRPRALRRACQ
jgi:hypothetical protein